MVDYNALESRLSEVEGLYLQNEGYTFEELFKVVCMSDLGGCGAGACQGRHFAAFHPRLSLSHSLDSRGDVVYLRSFSAQGGQS